MASENATLVVGAVIDPEMTDELRVTVVATGLGGEHKAQFGIVENSFKKTSGSDVTINSTVSTTTNPGVFVPSFASQASEETAPVATVVAEQVQTKEPAEQAKPEQENYFDIPAFLRKQAD